MRLVFLFMLLVTLLCAGLFLCTRTEPYVNLVDMYDGYTCPTNSELRTAGATVASALATISEATSAGVPAPEDGGDARKKHVTPDVQVDASGSLYYADRHHLTCAGDDQVLTSLTYLPSGDTLAAAYSCTQRERAVAHTPRYTAWAADDAGLGAHPAHCGPNAMSAYTIESQLVPATKQQNIRVRYDCAQDVVVDSEREKSYYTGWTAPITTVEALGSLAADCPDGTVLTGIARTPCVVANEETTTYTCAPIASRPPAAVPRRMPLESKYHFSNVNVVDEDAGELDNMSRNALQSVMNAHDIVDLLGTMATSGSGLANSMASVVTGFAKGLHDGFQNMSTRVAGGAAAALSPLRFTKLRGTVSRVGSTINKKMAAAVKDVVTGVSLGFASFIQTVTMTSSSGDPIPST